MKYVKRIHTIVDGCVFLCTFYLALWLVFHVASEDPPPGILVALSISLVAVKHRVDVILTYYIDKIIFKLFLGKKELDIDYRELFGNRL